MPLIHIVWSFECHAFHVSLNLARNWRLIKTQIKITVSEYSPNLNLKVAVGVELPHIGVELRNRETCTCDVVRTDLFSSPIYSQVCI